MVALLNAAPTIDRREDVEALRLALEAMRREAGQEISRLNRKLAEREYDAERIVATAAERQAMEQELSTLQSTLNDKEQVLDRITDECRRLEDELEDRHLVFDDLREEVARKDLSLKEAREEVERLQLALEELRERPSASTTPASPTVPTAPVPNVRTSSVGR
jgi:septal ring factor EnvC (AmiA/AmiB activator)